MFLDIFIIIKIELYNILEAKLLLVCRKFVVIPNFFGSRTKNVVYEEKNSN